MVYFNPGAEVFWRIPSSCWKRRTRKPSKPAFYNASRYSAA